MFKCRSLGMNANRRLYKGVVVPTVLYRAETWNMEAAKRRRLNAMEMRCLRSTFFTLREAGQGQKQRKLKKKKKKPATATPKS